MWDWQPPMLFELLVYVRARDREGWGRMSIPFFGRKILHPGSCIGSFPQLEVEV
jgi:hypothetical protein